MTEYFKGLELSSFWEESVHATDFYVGEKPDDDVINNIENELGYKLPQSYLELILNQNGGIPVNTCFPTEDTSWAKDHVDIEGIFGIDSKKECSLCGDMGKRLIKNEGYPDIGVYFGENGEGSFCLDYRKCGKSGEPQVVHVDESDNYKITFLADTFEEFITGLMHESQFEDEYYEYEVMTVEPRNNNIIRVLAGLFWFAVIIWTISYFKGLSIFELYKAIAELDGAALTKFVVENWGYTVFLSFIVWGILFSLGLFPWVNKFEVIFKKRTSHDTLD